jgi:hypothetical protein
VYRSSISKVCGSSHCRGTACTQLFGTYAAKCTGVHPIVSVFGPQPPHPPLWRAPWRERRASRYKEGSGRCLNNRWSALNAGRLRAHPTLEARREGLGKAQDKRRLALDCPTPPSTLAGCPLARAQARHTAFCSRLHLVGTPRPPPSGPSLYIVAGAPRLQRVGSGCGVSPEG